MHSVFPRGMFSRPPKTAPLHYGRRQWCRKQCILPAKETAIFKFHTRTIRIQSNRLSYLRAKACRIFYRYIFYRKTISMYVLQCFRALNLTR